MKNKLLLLSSVFLLNACSTINQKEDQFIVAQVCTDNIKSVKVLPFVLVKGNKNATEYSNSLILPWDERTVLVNCDSKNNNPDTIIGLGNATSLKAVSISLDGVRNDFERKDFTIYGKEWSNWEDRSNTASAKIRFKKVSSTDYLSYQH